MNTCERCGGAIPTAGSMHYAGPVCACGGLCDPAVYRYTGPDAPMAERIAQLETQNEMLRSQLAATERKLAAAEARLARIKVAFDSLVGDKWHDVEKTCAVYAALSGAPEVLATKDVGVCRDCGHIEWATPDFGCEHCDSLRTDNIILGTAIVTRRGVRE